MLDSPRDQRGFLTALIGDGRPLLTLVGLILFLVGLFALFLALTGHFLPHDIQFLGMSSEALCAVHGCRIVHFMMHDRAAFGGTLAAVGLLYLWLAEFPLRRGESWAWWVFLISGIIGFASFLAYLGYGYLDTWHGVATLAILPCQLLGLILARRRLHEPRCIRSVLRGGLWGRPFSRTRIGQACILGAGIGMAGAGAIIAMLGMTAVFVPTDLAYIGVSVADLQILNARLVPLIAHDRAGFGGALACFGILVIACVWRGDPSRGLWGVLAFAGLFGIGPAIAIHIVIGYDNLSHLAPAVGGATLYAFGLVLTRRSMCGER